MSVLINKKACDNARECSCIEDCPSKVFYLDEEMQKYNIKVCPSLLLAENGEIIKVFEDFCHINEKEKLFEYFKKTEV